MSASHNFPSRLASVGLQFVLGYCLFAAQTKFLFALAQDTVSDILIRGGTVVTSQREFLSDVLIYKGKIVKLGRNIDSSKAKRVIDAEGKYILPGGIDPHTHLEMSFMGAIACDDFSSGHKAALAGGTTMHIDFVVPMEGSLLKGYEAYRKKARIAHMDYGFHLVINTYNEQIEKEMEILVKEKGINSFKFFLAYKGALMISDEHFLQGMLKAKELGAIVQVHAENGDAVAYGQQYIFEDLKIHGPEGHALSRPVVTEEEATLRAITLARTVDAPLYVVHVMCEGAMLHVKKARNENVRVVGEATLAGLTLDESQMWSTNFTWAAAHVMSPPIRKHEIDGLALQKALVDGDIRLVGTDHAVFNSKQKRMGIDDFRKIPNGVNGLEERIPLLWEVMVNSGKISKSEFVRITSTEAAKIFNIYPRKGEIALGSDADLYIWDPSLEYEISAAKHHSNLDVNIFEGLKIQGKVSITLSQGKVVWENDTLTVSKGSGKFIETPPFSPYFYGTSHAAAVGRKIAAFKAPVHRSKFSDEL